MTTRLNHLHGDPVTDVLGQKIQSKHRENIPLIKKTKITLVLARRSLSKSVSHYHKSQHVVMAETRDNKHTKI